MIAQARTAEQVPDVAAGRILALLTAQSDEAQALAAAGDGSALQALLETRRVMLDELERTVQALGAERQRSASNRPPMSVHRERLLEMARELERANNELLATATAECLSIAAAIKELDRPDGVASAYANAAGSEPRRLDLVR